MLIIINNSNTNTYLAPPIFLLQTKPRLLFIYWYITAVKAFYYRYVLTAFMLCCKNDHIYGYQIPANDIIFLYEIIMESKYPT